MFIKSIKSFFKKLNERHSGKFKEIIVVDDKRRRAVFCIVVSALSVISLAMSILNIFTDERILMIVSFAFSIISLFNVLLVIFFKKIEKLICIAFIWKISRFLLFSSSAEFLTDSARSGFALFRISRCSFSALKSAADFPCRRFLS